MNLRYYLNVKYILKPEKAYEFETLLKEMKMEEKCADEEGCILYKYRGIKDNILELEELWTDKKHQQLHIKSEHIVKLGKVKEQYVVDTIVEEHTVYVPDEISDRYRNSEYSQNHNVKQNNRTDQNNGSDKNNEADKNIDTDKNINIAETGFSDVIPIDAVVSVPGSKSMTNRALLLAALSEGEATLNGVLFSDDSRHFLSSLESLGFDMSIDETEKTVKIRGTGGNIPHKTGTIDVGSAGTAARFLTAMLALSDGEYTIDCSLQMERRPMKPLFDVLESMGAEFAYLKEEGFLPVKVKGNQKGNSFISDEKVSKYVSATDNKEVRGDTFAADNPTQTVTVNMDISQSTQFLSAMLMLAPVMKNDLNIKITSEKKTGAYIHITMEMLKAFGANIEFNGSEYHIQGNQKMSVGNYTIEPDVSAACYFYAAAAMTGGKMTVKNVFYTSTQGDIRFLEVLKAIGCRTEEKSEGIEVTGPKGGSYNGIEVDMNNFSDQALTLAVVAAFARTETIIRNVGHIRGQECNRMKAITDELGKCGIKATETGDDIVIYPGQAHGALIDTYDDHRVAMSFNLMSLRTKGILIDNPMCCRKTFENYYEVFEEMFEQSFS